MRTKKNRRDGPEFSAARRSQRGSEAQRQQERHNSGELEPAAALLQPAGALGAASHLIRLVRTPESAILPQGPAERWKAVRPKEKWIVPRQLRPTPGLGARPFPQSLRPPPTPP